MDDHVKYEFPHCTEIQARGGSIVHQTRVIRNLFPYMWCTFAYKLNDVFTTCEDYNFMIVYMNDDFPIPPTFMLWRLHCREDAKNWGERYVGRMIAYNELSRTSGYEVVEDDGLYFVKNLDPEEKVDADKKVGDGVKIEKDENLGLDDCSIDLGAD